MDNYTREKKNSQLQSWKFLFCVHGDLPGTLSDVTWGSVVLENKFIYHSDLSTFSLFWEFASPSHTWGSDTTKPELLFVLNVDFSYKLDFELCNEPRRGAETRSVSVSSIFVIHILSSILFTFSQLLMAASLLSKLHYNSNCNAFKLLGSLSLGHTSVLFGPERQWDQVQPQNHKSSYWHSCPTSWAATHSCKEKKKKKLLWALGKQNFSFLWGCWYFSFRCMKYF